VNDESPLLDRVAAPASAPPLTGDTADKAPELRPRLGLALGGGVARGWAHLGILRVLMREGLNPAVITGTSIGAVVGGCYASGKLDELETFARSLSRRRLVGLLDFSIGGSGLIGGDRLRRLLESNLGATRIEELPARFAAIATELGTGHEIWLTRGPLIDALRASYALPGIFNPVKLGGRWLMDGALVNPIPVTAARALGAEVVVCINLNNDARLTRGTVIASHDVAVNEVTTEVPQGFRVGFFGRRSDGAPGIGTVMVDAFNITQDRIARSRLAGDPPDLMIAPKLGKLGLFEFHRATEAIDIGAEAAEKLLPDLRELLADAAARR
jgi:NTE family protein